jgi:succinate dehydrogenase flavin-adding protein (antitoxin of CptAB toxin-antitoxin module)
MKELDLMLSGWVRARYAQADEQQRARFLSLLDLPDPDLVRYLLGGQRPPSPELTAAVDAVLTYVMSAGALGNS